MNRRLRKLIIAVGLLLPTLILAQLTGRDIMQKVDQQGDVQSEYARTKMILVNKRGQTRERDVVRYQKDYNGQDGFDSKQLVIFEFPADIRGTGLLIWSYTDIEKDDDRWLYLPALKKIRRIAGESKNDYFMGTDFTYDDMGGRNLDEDIHELLGKEQLDGEECYKVASVPVDRDDMYSRKIAWVIPDKWITKQVEFYDQEGELLKVLKAADIREVDGVWTPFNLHMHNLQDNHQTRIEIQSVEFNREVDESTFTTNTLQRGRVR